MGRQYQDEPYHSPSSSSNPPIPEDNPLDDLPPSYDDAITQPPQNATPVSPLGAAAYCIPDGRTHPRKGENNTITLNPTLSQDATVLCDLITRQSRAPPRPCLDIRGSHRETRSTGSSREGRREDKTETVQDFAFMVDLRRALLRWDEGDAVVDGVAAGTRWFDVRVAADGDGQKVFRGGRFRSTEFTNKQKRTGLDVEDGVGGDEGQGLMGGDGSSPGLMGWCERFCNDPAPVKSFTFERKLEGFKFSSMRDSLISQIRALNYRGDIMISLSLLHGSVTVYSPHWINRLRNNKFVFWVCVILQLWIITWPIIWLLERRYEVVQSVWYSSREVKDSVDPSGSRKVYACGQDEASLAGEWGPAITQAAWERRLDGLVLCPQDLTRLFRAGRERMERMNQTPGVLLNPMPMMMGMVRGVGQPGRWDMTWGWGADN